MPCLPAITWERARAHVRGAARAGVASRDAVRAKQRAADFGNDVAKAQDTGSGFSELFDRSVRYS